MKENELLPGLFAFGLGLWVENDRALVIADLHLGIEEMFSSQGILVPRFNFLAIKKHLGERVFPKVKPETIVINGDLKHEFGTISGQEWSEVIEMLRFLQKHCKRIVLIRGNHDTILGPIAKWENLSIEREGLLLEKSLVFVTHGEEIPKSAAFKKAKTVVVGHEHPALTIRDKHRAEQFKCFLAGRFGSKSLVVMPSINHFSIGTDAREGNTLGPFLKKGFGKFRVFAVADKVYDFGPLENLD